MLIEGNTIVDTPGLAILIASSDGVILRNNTIIRSNQLPFSTFRAGEDVDAQARGSIMVTRASNVTLIGNHQIVSPDMFDKGIYVDLRNTSNVTVQDNTEERAKPKLLTEENPTRAIALDSVTFVRDPFTLFTRQNFSADQRTRVLLFSADVFTEDFSAITAQAEDSQQRVYPLTVEYVGRVANFGWLTQINLRLPDELVIAGDVQVSISGRGLVSNKALISIRE